MKKSDIVVGGYYEVRIPDVDDVYVYHVLDMEDVAYNYGLVYFDVYDEKGILFNNGVSTLATLANCVNRRVKPNSKHWTFL